MTTTFTQETILFQNNFVITDNQGNDFPFRIPSLSDVFNNENMILLRWIIGEKKESISALFFPKTPTYFKSKSAVIMGIVSDELLIQNFKELLAGLETYFYLHLEDKKLLSNIDIPVSEEILEEMLNSFSISFNFEFIPIEDKNSALDKAKADKFIPPVLPKTLDSFMAKMLIQEKKREWEKEQVEKRKADKSSNLEKTKADKELAKKGFITSPMYKIFISIIETYNLTLSEIQEFSLYKMYWYYQKVILIDQQKVLRIAQGNGLLGEKTKYAYYVGDTGE